MISAFVKVTRVRCALACIFLIGFGQSELSHADCVDLRNAIPTL